MNVLEKLAKSNFGSRFKLKAKDLEYIEKKGLDAVRSHTCDFIRNRVALANIPNDGKQTPMRGHPVFIVQHVATTCCRGCIEKWHHFPKGVDSTDTQQKYLVDIIMEWIERQVNSNRIQ